VVEVLVRRLALQAVSRDDASKKEA
jgi:hypothetical protein